MKNEYAESTMFIDLEAQQRLVRAELEQAILRVLDHGQYIMGPEVKALEQQLSDFSGVRHALTCGNGTDALTIVLMAWGIGLGDAVFVPSFTYVATAEAPAQLGATPFFVDVLEDTFNLDPDSFKQAIFDCKKHGLKPSVVIVVDLFGHPADIDTITSIAHNEGIKVLVDGAQSFGATSKHRSVGCMGDATTTSFFPAKPLGCYGDGGAVFTNSDEDAERINSIRLHGKGDQKYDNVRVGLNSRLDTIQAAVLLQKLRLFPDELDLRAAVAHRYSQLLSDDIKVPTLLPDHTSAWAQYTLRLKDRSHIQNLLRDNGIPTVVYYPIPLSKQAGYRDFPSVKGGTPVSAALSEEVLSLPMHPYLRPKDQDRITQLINQNAFLGD